MEADFKSFETIRHVMSENNSRIIKFTDLAVLYLGFCEHFLSYLDAYETLFKKKNYYACHAITRIMVDLYIKSRLLAETDNPEDLADWLWNDKPLKDYRNFSKIKGDLTDMALCKYFDEKDFTYPCYLGAKKKIIPSCQGKWEHSYRELSKFIHPNKKSAVEYWKKHKWSEQERKMLEYIEQNNGIDFELLASETHMQLAQICCKILAKQWEDSKSGEKN